MARIELEAIGHAYGKGDVDAFSIADLNLTWEDGSANALLGPSGCGKTTILNVISGLLRPDSGRVTFDGRDVTALDARGRHIAQVFQFPVVYETMDVFGNLAFPLRNRKMAEPEVDRRVREIAELLELTDELKTPARGLTPALKQIVSLGRGIVREDTAAVLLDEPLTVIDPKLKWHLRRKLRDVQRATGLTMIYVTHDQHEALTFADSVTVMHDGDVVQTGSPQELHERPATPFVGYFIGSPGMNLIPCERMDSGLNCGAFRLPLPAASNDHTGGQSGELMAGVRPEHVRIAGENDANAIEASVTNVEHAGAYSIVTASSGETSFRLRAHDWHALQPGATIHCAFDAAKLHLYDGGATR